jgi:hypothetical protein
LVSETGLNLHGPQSPLGPQSRKPVLRCPRQSHTCWSVEVCQPRPTFGLLAVGRQWADSGAGHLNVLASRRDLR